MQFSCFVEGCERKCLTHQKRRMHMIDKHMYPKNFFFAVTKEGIDGRRSLLNDGHGRRRSSTATQNKEIRRREDTREPSSPGKKSPNLKPATAKPEDKDKKSQSKVDTEMEDLTGAMSSLQFVPQSVRFGRGRRGFAKA